MGHLLWQARASAPNLPILPVSLSWHPSMVYRRTAQSILAGSKPKRYPGGRVCERPDCHTRLSVYNPQDFCARHRPRKRPRVRGHEPLTTLPKCAKCAARARGRTDLIPEIEWAHVIHREGQEGAAILCEGYLSTEGPKRMVIGHDSAR